MHATSIYFIFVYQLPSKQYHFCLDLSIYARTNLFTPFNFNQNFLSFYCSKQLNGLAYLFINLNDVYVIVVNKKHTLAMHSIPYEVNMF